MDGLRLAAGISALLIAILGMVALVDKLLGAGSSWLGMSESLSFVRILSWFFYPFAFLLGLQTSDVPIAARLLGERVILTEVFSYNHLAQLISSGQVTDPDRGDPELRALRIRTRGSGGNLCRRHCRTCSLTARRPRQPRLTSLTGCYAGDADDPVCGGDLQQRRRGVALENGLS